MAPFKRARQPKMTTQALLDFDLGESSSDSDFRIEDHNTSDDNSDVSKDEDSAQDDSSSDDNDSSDDENSNESKHNFLPDMEAHTNGGNNFLSIFKKAEIKCKEKPKFPLKPICCICLGDRSDDTNEIVECDNCGVSVHECCYGVSDDSSISSTNSTCSTEPWFCDACRAGVDKPVCELCPNTFTSIYKETDVGKWVHLVCALYVPGVAFGEVDRLANVTLFEMQYNKWGNRVCSLCEDPKMARTGVSIECDAGFCKNYFHATCAQAAGFLIEAHHEEAEAADPFYAQCKTHSDSEVVKKRKRNYQIFAMNMAQKQVKPFDTKLTASPSQQRIQRKLLKSQRKYETYRKLKSEAWVPTQRLPRVLDTTATALRSLKKKTELFDVDAESLERQNAQIAAVTNIRKKWQIPAAFSVEFVAYYLDRIPRANELKEQLAKMVKTHDSLTEDQNLLRKDYDAKLEKNKELKKVEEAKLAEITQLHKQLTALCPTKQLPNPANIGHRIPNEPAKSTVQPSRPISVPTAAALKMGVGFPLAHLGPPGTKVNSNRLLSTHAKHSPNVTVSGASSAPTTPTLGVHTYDCGICKRCTDQHLLVKCDTCKVYYHLGCLNPPLTRHPKKSKLYGWQCSECDKSDVSDAVTEIPKGPRKSRTRFNRDGSIIPKHILHMQTVKRRSTDDRYTKKPRLNNSLPDTAHLINSAAKKPKVLLKNISPQLANIEKLTSCVKASLANLKETTPQTSLATVEPLVIVEQNPATARSAEAIDPLALPSNNNVSYMLNSSKQARKQKRKGKHKSKHNESSESDKSPSKEHKRKRKKKVYDFDYPSDQLSSIPQIKIKFKTLPLPGEVTPEAQFRYVPADMVRSAAECSRPTSVETVEDASPSELVMTPAKHLNTAPQPIIARRKSSPRKANQRMSFEGNGRKSRGSAPVYQNLFCCICSDVGISSNVVTCDECRKHYHFTCLEPPLKKTPKIRGYSWHCADCDPTDEEHK